METARSQHVTKRLRELRERAGLSMSDMAEILGLKGPSSYQRYEDPALYKKDGLSNSRVMKLLSVLVGKGDPKITAEEVRKLSGFTFMDQESYVSADAVRNSLEHAPLVSDKREFPVFGAAEGGPEGAMVLSADPIEWVKRPEVVPPTVGGFGVYVVGESMRPAYRQGDIALVHPAKPFTREDDVILVRRDDHDDHHVLIKTLVNWTKGEWRVREYYPAEREFTLSRSDWSTIYVVVGRYNRR